MFDNQVVGTISNGVLTVPVYTTGTPYKTYTVTSTGYLPYTGSITQYPEKGQTVDLYATLNLAPTPTTKAPLTPLAVLAALAGIAFLAAWRRQ
jgi:hypothetical protein